MSECWERRVQTGVRLTEEEGDGDEDGSLPVPHVGELGGRRKSKGVVAEAQAATLASIAPRRVPCGRLLVASTRYHKRPYSGPVYLYATTELRTMSRAIASPAAIGRKSLSRTETQYSVLRADDNLHLGQKRKNGYTPQKGIIVNMQQNCILDDP